MSVSSPVLQTASSLNWDLLRDLLQCPRCTHAALDLSASSLRCKACAAIYSIVDGVIDFAGDAPPEIPTFYRNRFYRRFIDALDQIHAVHYEGGSLSARLEIAMKRDLFTLVLPGSGPNVDLGCGLGGAFEYIGRDEDIVGTDLSLPLLLQTKKLHPKASILRADLAHLPFRSGVLPRIFANAVLEHVFHLERAIEQVARCLAPSGIFYAAFPTEGSLAVGAARLATSSRNARILGISPAQSRIAQRIDHCNTVFGLDNALRKHFFREARSFWPFKVPSRQINLSVAYRLRHRREDDA